MINRFEWSENMSTWNQTYLEQLNAVNAVCYEN